MSNHYLKSIFGGKEISRQDNIESLLNAVSMAYDNMPRYNFSLTNSKGQLLTETSDTSLITDEFNVAFKFPLVYSIGDNPEKIFSRNSVFCLEEKEDDGNYEYEEPENKNDIHLTIHQWGGYPYVGKFSFKNKCSKLTILATDEPVLTQVTSMDSCFQDVDIEIGPLSKGLSEWDVSNVTNMDSMFSYSFFDGDISRWDVSNAIRMGSMFYNLGFNGDISKWDVSNVISMVSTFSCSYFNGDISKWDVSNVTDMDSMFYSSKFTGDISKWNVSNVIRMNYMFSESGFDCDISKWDVSNVTNMDYMFSHSKFNGDISKWNVSNVTNMDYMFSLSKFNGDISKWNVSNVTNIDYMFYYSKFNG